MGLWTLYVTGGLVFVICKPINQNAVKISWNFTCKHSPLWNILYILHFWNILPVQVRSSHRKMLKFHQFIFILVQIYNLVCQTMKTRASSAWTPPSNQLRTNEIDTVGQKITKIYFYIVFTEKVTGDLAKHGLAVCQTVKV